MKTIPCGGCGNRDPEHQCFGCRHQFYEQFPISKFECVVTFIKEDDQPKFHDFILFVGSKQWNQQKEDACIITAMDLLREQWHKDPYGQRSDVHRVYMRGTLQLFVLPTRDDAPEYRVTVNHKQFAESGQEN